MTSPDYSEGVPRSVIDERRAKMRFAPSDPGDTACTVCAFVGAAVELGNPCVRRICPGVFVPILDDPEPEPAPVEGAVERIEAEVERWFRDRAACEFRGYVPGRVLDVAVTVNVGDLRAVLDELERWRKLGATGRDLLDRIQESAESIQTEPSDTHWLSPKGGEPATPEAPSE